MSDGDERTAATRIGCALMLLGAVLALVIIAATAARV